MQDGQSLIFSYSKLWCMIGFPHFKQASFKKCNLLKQSLHIEYVLVSFIGLSQIMHEIFLGYIKSNIVSLKDLSIDFISSIFFISFIYILFIFILLSKSSLLSITLLLSWL